MSTESMQESTKSPTVTGVNADVSETTSQYEIEVKPFVFSGVAEVTPDITRGGGPTTIDNKHGVTPMHVDGDSTDASPLLNEKKPVTLHRNVGVKNGGIVKPDGTRALTAKERDYVAYRIANPRANKVDSMKATYDVKQGLASKTYSNMATAIERRPAVLAILTEHATKAEQMLVDLANDTAKFAKSGTKEGAMYASTAERVLNSMLDRVHGKATQRIEQQSTGVTITIDMTAKSDDGVITEQK